ncbi:hypothetical protein L227DRAFT_568643 [Lentinus tigrinus ALCF2SS1-6]|uniref:Uncharacterized protein n=1 Tax=Lentinus tigrinus ALCF2SS1-6 TaxID=1328759 RepID=A0A5C2RMN0_9APHY|nr:hypothetical protein L227DRAFT_568643 [Lentinus tigrinus ALCF2SS1-6]
MANLTSATVEEVLFAVHEGYVAPGIEKFTQSNDSEEVAQMGNKEPNDIENFSDIHLPESKTITCMSSPLIKSLRSLSLMHWQKCYDVEIPADHPRKVPLGQRPINAQMHYPSVLAKKLVDASRLLFQHDVGGLESSIPTTPTCLEVF